jgi:hypothetical protein
MKKYSMSLITNQNSNEIASHPNENGYDKKKLERMLRKRNILYCWWELN